MSHEQVMDHRTAANRGVVQAVNDAGVVQIVDVVTHDGVTRSAVEVHQPFGFASSPPENGAVVFLIANGGDHSDLVALAASAPWARFGGLQRGETAIYAVDGTRVHIRLGGIVEIKAATKVIITAPNGVDITGDVNIDGSLTNTGNLTGGTGASGSFTTPLGQKVTVRDGVITNID